MFCFIFAENYGWSSLHKINQKFINFLISELCLSLMYYRGLKFVPLGFKRLLILQSVNKVNLNLNLANLTSEAKIFRKQVAFAMFWKQ